MPGVGSRSDQGVARYAPGVDVWRYDGAWNGMSLLRLTGGTRRVTWNSSVVGPTDRSLQNPRVRVPVCVNVQSSASSVIPPVSYVLASVKRVTPTVPLRRSLRTKTPGQNQLPDPNGLHASNRQRLGSKRPARGRAGNVVGKAHWPKFGCLSIFKTRRMDNWLHRHRTNRVSCHLQGNIVVPWCREHAILDVFRSCWHHLETSHRAGPE